MDDTAKELVKRSDKLFSAKEGLNSLHQTLAEHFYPARANFTTELSLNDEFASHLFDSSPPLAHRDLNNAFSAMLRPRGQQWFKASVPDDDLREAPGVSRFLEFVTRTMWNTLYARKSRFSRATKEGDGDFAAFGYCVISAELPDDGTAGIKHRCHHPKDCAFAEDSDGEIDTAFRDFYWSARQIEQRWGDAAQYPDAIHREIRKACEKDPDKVFKLRHALLPAADYEYSRKKNPGKAKWVSVYIDVDNRHLIAEAPSYDFRYVIPRWQTIQGSPYAVSPAAMISLPDARMIQNMARVMLEAGEKTVDPPLKAHQGGVAGEINMHPSGVTWIERDYDEKLGPAIEPLYLPKDVRLGVELLNRTQAMITEAWYLNKLKLPQQGAKTAFETAQLVEEYIRAAIPLFEPMETSYNGALLDLDFAIMARAGAFGDPREWPDELFDGDGRAVTDITFTFSNPLQDAIEKNKVMQFQGTMGLMGLAAQFDPGVRFDTDVRAGYRDAVRGQGAPSKWLTNKDDADEAIANAAEEQKAIEGAKELGMAGQVAEQVGKGGAAMKQAFE